MSESLTELDERGRAEAAMWQENLRVAAYLASGAFDGEEIDLDAS